MDISNEAAGSPNHALGASPDAPVVLPISPAVQSNKPLSTLSPVVCDERAITGLLRLMIQRSGLSINAASRIWGVDRRTISEALNGHRTRPSLLWFLRFAELCGARVLIEFPR